MEISTPTDREIRVTRVFDAPRERLYHAFARPELWFGPSGSSVTVYENDRRPGGRFRWVLHAPGKRDVCVRGTFLEIEPPERSVAMESIDDYSIEWRVTVVFTEASGKTTLTATVLFPSRETRDIVLQSGLERHAIESYDKLARSIQLP